MICQNCHCNTNKLVTVSRPNKALRVCIPCRRAFMREQQYIQDNKKY